MQLSFPLTAVQTIISGIIMLSEHKLECEDIWCKKSTLCEYRNLEISCIILPVPPFFFLENKPLLYFGHVILDHGIYVNL